MKASVTHTQNNVALLFHVVAKCRFFLLNEVFAAAKTLLEIGLHFSYTFKVLLHKKREASW